MKKYKLKEKINGRINKKFVSLMVIAFLGLNTLSSPLLVMASVNSNINKPAPQPLANFNEFIALHANDTDVDIYRNELKSALITFMSQAFENKVDLILNGLTNISDLKDFADKIKDYDSQGSGTKDIVVTTIKDENPTTNVQTIVGYHINGAHGTFLVQDTNKNKILTGSSLNITHNGQGFTISPNAGNGFSSDYGNNTLVNDVLVLKYKTNTSVDPYAAYTPVHTHKRVVVYDVDGKTIIEEGELDYDTQGPVDRNLSYKHISGKPILIFSILPSTGKLRMGYHTDVSQASVISVSDSASLLEYKLVPIGNDAVYTPKLYIYDNLQPNAQQWDLAHFGKHNTQITSISIVNKAFEDALTSFGLSANEWKNLNSNVPEDRGAYKNANLTFLYDYLRQKGVNESDFYTKFLQNLNLDPNNYHVELMYPHALINGQIMPASDVSREDLFSITIRPGKGQMLGRTDFDSQEFANNLTFFSKPVVVYSKLNMATGQEEHGYSPLKNGAHPMISSELENVLNHVFLKHVINNLENKEGDGHVHSLDNTLKLQTSDDLDALKHELTSLYPNLVAPYSQAELDELVVSLLHITQDLVRTFSWLENTSVATQPDGSKTQLNLDSAHITVDEKTQRIILNMNDLTGTSFNNRVGDKIPVVYVQSGTHNPVPGGINPHAIFEPTMLEPGKVLGQGIVPIGAVVPGTTSWKVNGAAVLVTDPDGTKHWEIPAQTDKIPVVYVQSGTHNPVPGGINPTTLFDSTMVDPSKVVGQGIVPTNDVVPGTTSWKVNGTPILVTNPDGTKHWEIPAQTDKIPVVYVQHGTHNVVPGAINPTTLFDSTMVDPSKVVGSDIATTNNVVPGTTSWKVDGPAVLVTNPDGTKHWEIPAQTDKIPVVYVQSGTHNPVPGAINPTTLFDSTMVDPSKVVGSDIATTNNVVPGTTSWKVDGPAVLVTNPDGTKHWEIPAQTDKIPVVYVQSGTHNLVPGGINPTTLFDSTMVDPSKVVGSDIATNNSLIPGTNSWTVNGTPVLVTNPDGSKHWEIPAVEKIPVVYVQNGTHNPVPGGINPNVKFDSTMVDPSKVVGQGIVPTNGVVPGTTSWKVIGKPVLVTNPDGSKHWEIPAQERPQARSMNIPVVYVQDGTHNLVPGAIEPSTTFDQNMQDPNKVIGQGIVQLDKLVPGTSEWMVDGKPVLVTNPDGSKHWEIPAIFNKVPVVYVQHGTHNLVPGAINPNISFDLSMTNPNLVIGNGIVGINANVPGNQKWVVDGKPVLVTNADGSKHWEIPAHLETLNNIATKGHLNDPRKNVRGASQIQNNDKMLFVFSALTIVGAIGLIKTTKKDNE